MLVVSVLPGMLAFNPPPLYILINTPYSHIKGVPSHKIVSDGSLLTSLLESVLVW